MSNKAFKIYHQIFDDEEGQVSLKEKGQFAEGFLKEMSGLRSPVKIQSQSVHTTLTAEELAEFKKRGVAAARESGLVIDVEPTDETKEVKNDSVD